MRKLTEIIKDTFKKDQCDIPQKTTDILGPPVERVISIRSLVEIIEHEGIVLEAYKDSKGIWTWGVGVTSMSGHKVERYIDNPQTLEKVLNVYSWLLETKYLPAVLRAFKGYKLSENELAAALSFHWNTGGIERASWVKEFLAGNIEKAKASFMNWRSPPEIISRRKAERDLFFEGKWTSDGKVPVYGVSKPSYQPKGVTLMDVSHLL